MQSKYNDTSCQKDTLTSMESDFGNLNHYEKKFNLITFGYFKFTLGGLEDNFKQKNINRLKHGLNAIIENPSEILSKMAPATPPPNPVDVVNDIQNGLAGMNGAKKSKKVNFQHLFCNKFASNF